MSEFIQRGVVLKNQFESDTALLKLIQKNISKNHLVEVKEKHKSKTKQDGLLPFWLLCWPLIPILLVAILVRY